MQNSGKGFKEKEKASNRFEELEKMAENGLKIADKREAEPRYFPPVLTKDGRDDLAR